MSNTETLPLLFYAITVQLVVFWDDHLVTTV